MYKLTAQVVAQKRTLYTCTLYMLNVHVECTDFSQPILVFSQPIFTKLVEKIPKLVEKNLYIVCVQLGCTCVRNICTIGRTLMTGIMQLYFTHLAQLNTHHL